VAQGSERRPSGLPTSCPGCGGGLVVTQLCCTGCQAQLEGQFELPELLQLGREDLRFVIEFVRCSGSLKDMGKLLGQSYPTVRNRLNDIIARLSSDADDVEQRRRDILDALARGDISVREATASLKELER
jgi:hypothetical protein